MQLLGGFHFFRMSHMLCFPGVAAFSGYGSSQRLSWVGGHRADTWELQAGACNHLALAKANRTELLLAEPLALALCAWLKLRPTYLHVWEKEKKHAVSGWQLKQKQKWGGRGMSDLNIPFSGTWHIPTPVYQISIHLHVCGLLLLSFFKDSKLKMEMALKAEVCGEKNSLTCIYLSLFLGL